MRVPLRFINIDWYCHVNSEAFERDCHEQSIKHFSSGFRPHRSESFEYYNLRESDDPYDLTYVDSSEHGVEKFEAYLYYVGLRGNRKLGPKLIYRTSTDIFQPPYGQHRTARMMQLLTVHNHAKLSQDNLWATIRQETVKILDYKQIKLTSVDLVCFRWEWRNEDGSREPVTSRVTIWIGVRRDSTNGDAAFDATQDILKLLEGYGIDDIDIAYRESEAHPLAGPILLAPVGDFHPLKSVIDWITTSLSLPIAGLKTLHMEGSLGFYFKSGEDLYGVTARHVLFPDTEGNDSYSYSTSAPKKNVVLMGNRAFEDLLAAIQALIGKLNAKAFGLEKNIEAYEARVAGGDPQAAAGLAKFQQILQKTRNTVVELKNFFVTLKIDWADVRNRIIGHVVWSPPITGLTPPYNYTRDVCVIKLDKQKFLPNFRGNAIDLGTEIECGKLMWLLDPQYDMPPKFDYPLDRMYRPKIFLAAADVKEANNEDIEGDSTRFVIKRGHTTLTTIGRLNGYESHQRRYSLLGNFDSVEAAVLPYDSNESDPFSRGGDSGSAIVGTHHDFVAQLTSGTGPTDSSDITYGTPMEWLWNDVIKAEFPNAVLFFEDFADS
ncbi:hypothetical protein BDY19DRAFT_983828 [Irpex rosettiformis]|uniref:Uncharacterized protein n=1 Tax=Irpex rosettiformis TaxID=378272 RepID=A0ACB8UB10_9APHY|nr:hypothetical protein BDY19DRAFT_983828 [Irpex rosettiformis]